MPHSPLFFEHVKTEKLVPSSCLSVVFARMQVQQLLHELGNDKDRKEFADLSSFGRTCFEDMASIHAKEFCLSQQWGDYVLGGISEKNTYDFQRSRTMLWSSAATCLVTFIGFSPNMIGFGLIIFAIGLSFSLRLSRQCTSANENLNDECDEILEHFLNYLKLLKYQGRLWKSLEYNGRNLKKEQRARLERVAEKMLMSYDIFVGQMRANKFIDEKKEEAMEALEDASSQDSNEGKKDQ
eukprot:CAMPEP_0184656388 /NCGR_PEP_ID=MMETSP0308-20130426/16464_1 /TAXON_ID=38269 /ORGANISM="Gloeochaete witrockiana, Strain SAG 46.84" /LENGTH=238 /DNA_ID=CAMNT_0027093501 /DNA_START=303 /DNA_END=1019 /DNA_ORIENTATION=+